jgi:hypothetical protein
MGAALAFALRRSSARVVVAVAAGGLVLTVFRAVRPARTAELVIGVPATRLAVPFLTVGSSPWDLAAASLVAVLAVVAAARIYRRAAA